MVVLVNKSFDPTLILQDLVNKGDTGRLEVISNSVTWNIYLCQGKLQYAYHSLQSIEMIKYYLISLNLKSVAQNLSSFSDINQNQSIISLINQLIKQGYINDAYRINLLKEASRDAIEFFLWLSEADYQWYPSNSDQEVGKENLIEIPPLLKSFTNRMQEWQKLAPLIKSPYQRPVRLSSSDQSLKVPAGSLSPSMLEKLFKVMRGATIRDIGLLLKQPDLKVAQVLLPYIKHQVIGLMLPKAPLDKLPRVPQVSSKSSAKSITNNLLRETPTNKLPQWETKISSVATSTSNQSVTPATSTTTLPIAKPTNSVSSQKQVYKIVSIDDSPTMLDLIKSYLGSERYEIFTLENPMLSISYLFDIKPDLILMDFSMPGINGNKLCEIIRKRMKLQTIPIIMVSGNLKMNNQSAMKNSGITDYLTKPFTKADLFGIVEKYLD